MAGHGHGPIRIGVTINNKEVAGLFLAARMQRVSWHPGFLFNIPMTHLNPIQNV